MDRSIAWQQLMDWLISPSAVLEKKRIRGSQSALNRTLRSLEILDGLETMTRDSLAVQIQLHNRPQNKPTQNKSVPQSRYGTARSEYRPALSDPSIINALLSLKKNAAPSTEKQNQQSQQGQGFTAPSAPNVDAKPKNSYFKKTPGIFHPILRSNNS